MNTFKHFFLLIVTFFLVVSCSEQNEVITPSTSTDANNTTITNTSNNIINNTPCGTPVVSTFNAGQHINIGTVTVTNTATQLFVTFSTQNNWVLGQTHLYVGSLANMPATPNGNPKIGNFPSSTTHSPMVTTFTYTYDLSTLDSCFIVAAHAEAHLLNSEGEIVQSETAWANDVQFNNSGSWAGYMNYCVQECEPCVYDTISYDFYGGQTILVGNVEVINDATNLYVTFNTTGGWNLAETHLYIGSLANLPTNNSNTPIPGQFPYQATHIAGTTTYTYTIPLSSISDSCFIIATHASVSQSNGVDDEQYETAWSFGTEDRKSVV